MPFFKAPDGTVFHVKMSRTPRRRCSVPGCRDWMDRLCDFVAPGHRKSCDKPLCRRHARSVGRDLDHCPDHPVDQKELAL